MGDAACRLQQKETHVRIGGVQASTAELAEQAGVIEGGVGSEEGEAKAVLPLDRPVTGAGVAAEAAEDRLDVPAEPWRLGLRATADQGAGQQSSEAEQEGQ